jgi:predicted lipoprotein with Yx(FWY)xxD motif
MRWRLKLASVIAAVVVIAACGSSSKTASKYSTTASTSTSTSSESTTTTAAAASSGATLGTATNSTIGQQILVDSSGRTVYLFMPDGSSKTTTVPAAIKANWPPVKSTATPTVGAGLDQSKIAADTQADGSDQVAYGGHLLYTFAGDKAAGDAKGQGLGGFWYVLSPAGTKIG